MTKVDECHRRGKRVFLALALQAPPHNAKVRRSAAEARVDGSLTGAPFELLRWSGVVVVERVVVWNVAASIKQCTSNARCLHPHDQHNARAVFLPLLDLLIFQGAGPGATFRFLTASCRSHAWAARSLSPTCGCVSWAGAVGVARGSWASHGTCWPPHSARSPCSARSLSSTVRPRVARVELARRDHPPRRLALYNSIAWKV